MARRGPTPQRWIPQDTPDWGELQGNPIDPFGDAEPQPDNPYEDPDQEDPGKEKADLWHVWIAYSMCPTCQQNANAGPIRVGDLFPSGVPYPPAHHNCECDTMEVEPPGTFPRGLRSTRQAREPMRPITIPTRNWPDQGLPQYPPPNRPEPQPAPTPTDPYNDGAY